MKVFTVLLFVLICLNSVFYAHAKKFAVLVATTKTWLHYGHQVIQFTFIPRLSLFALMYAIHKNYVSMYMLLVKLKIQNSDKHKLPLRPNQCIRLLLRYTSFVQVISYWRQDKLVQSANILGRTSMSYGEQDNLVQPTNHMIGKTQFP